MRTTIRVQQISTERKYAYPEGSTNRSHHWLQESRQLQKENFVGDLQGSLGAEFGELFSEPQIIVPCGATE